MTEDCLGDRRSRVPLSAVALPLLLLGCTSSGALTATSAGFAGLSYMASGKSVSDHAISQVTDQNCATWRIFVGRAICRDYTPEEQRENQLARARLAARDPAESRVTEPRYAGLREPSAPLIHPERAQVESGGGTPGATAPTQATSSLTALRPAANITAPEASHDDGVERTVNGSPIASETMDASERHGVAARGAPRPPATLVQTDYAAGEPLPVLPLGKSSNKAPDVAGPKPAPTVVAIAASQSEMKAASMPAARDHHLYLVLASFASRVNAERALDIYAGAHPDIASVTVGGATLHRLIAGPFEADELAAARARIEKSNDIRNIWVLPICARDGASGCVTRVLAGGAVAQLAPLSAAG